MSETTELKLCEKCDEPFYLHERQVYKGRTLCRECAVDQAQAEQAAEIDTLREDNASLARDAANINNKAAEIIEILETGAFYKDYDYSWSLIRNMKALLKGTVMKGGTE